MKTTLKKILAFVFLLSACGPSQEEIQATIQVAIAQTQNAVPANSASPTLSIVEIELDPEIFQIEDLGLVGGPSTKENPFRYYILLPNGVNQLSREILSQDGNHSGWVSIVVYETSDECESTFTEVLSKMKEYNTSKPSQNSYAYEVSGTTGVVLYQGNLLINIDTDENIEFDSLVFYAESLVSRIHERLQP